MVMPAVCEAMESIPSLQFEVFGTIKMPPELGRFGRRARHIAPVSNYAEFLPFLRSLGWWIGVAPLEDNSFNRCKADTKWVEYSVAGIAVVASDLPVYHRACDAGSGVLASTSKQWNTAIQDLVTNPQQRMRMVEAAQTKLRRLYNHKRLCEQVVNMFDQASQIVAKSNC
jgi:glycosyltransferase involved in cell wall biosynthesis